MQFRILGPLEVWDDDRPVSVGGPQQRALLAVLLVDANRVVSADRLVGELWHTDPPPAARRLLQGCVRRLRRVLPGDRLLTSQPGYLLRVLPGEVDADRFDELVAAAAGSDDAGASALLAEALELWRGPALDGVTAESCQTWARELEERRQTVLEDRIDADLRLGRHHDLAGELRALVGAQPLRERRWAQLIRALHAAGRQADALAAYRDLRQVLVDQLGVEPSAEVQEIHRAILAGDAPAEPGPAPVPAQLPAAIATFTGRDEQLKELDSRLGAGTVVVTAIDGTAGVGKTALAVHWAHRVRERFADGQLYVNLRGFAPAPPMRPIDALVGFLRAMGVAAEEIPVDVEQAAALYRTLLADRRMLILLDNARNPDQVRPLLPGGAGCLVLVTSRDKLNGLVALDGAHRVTLDVLAPDEAAVLLARIIGRERVEAEPDATGELARVCALLPLALRIAAANLADQPWRTVAGFAAALAEGNRLAELSVAGDDRAAVRAAFDLSYATLPVAAQRVFALLGLVPGPDVTQDAAAALAGIGASEAGTSLDRLAAAHLLAQHAPGRYTFHDLLRAYAAQHGERTADRDAASRRLHHWYVRTAHAATRVLYPHMLFLPVDTEDVFGEPAEALAWLDDERPNLVAAVTPAGGPPAWLLADALRGYLMARMHTVDWLTVAEAGLDAATAAGDLTAQAAARLSLGDAHQRLSRYPEAVGHYTAGLGLAQRAHWTDGQAALLRNLGNVYWPMGRLRDAADHYTRALALYERAGQTAGQALSLGSLGLAYRHLGRLADAADHLGRALILFRDIGSRSAEAACLGNLAEVCHDLGELDRAAGHGTRSLDLYRESGDRGGEADTCRVLAGIHLDLGDPGRALDLARTALDLARDIRDRRVEANALNTLSTVYERIGRYRAAVQGHRQALDLAEESGNAYPKAQALLGLATAHRGRHELPEAESTARRAVETTCEIGYRALEGRALALLAVVQLDLGRPQDAARSAREALSVCRATGIVPTELQQFFHRRPVDSASPRLEST
ncbi:SARP family transcriptional regulator [Lentzea sp. NBRC 105346]|uniref:AfsR/SARP family transcriptional regulator n=1 Tax=Lentzea sp. NBRC 105346 TaxID=3032205 RepID=UPI0024A03B97|nr:BTAD domain-containing putative transcriptional regulator [Lentzea sp. NBRC 105346]GLZ35346.1 SARP family transcriptional regulator [Lentzea sp. NBRC 105346]